MKRLVGIVLKLLVTVGLFALLFRPQTYGLRPDLFGGITPASLWRELTGSSLSTLAFWLSLAIVIKLSGMMAGVLRWRLLLQGQGLSMPFWYMVQSWFVGRMFGIFVPGTIGLDGYRLYDSTLYTREPLKNVTVIAVEKLIGFVSLTFLVFLTFPLGFRLLKINTAALAVILMVLGAFVIVSFLLLLNPRVIQVLLAIAPIPAAIRNKIDKLGAAITAYSGHRWLLMAAVASGFWVHLATCLMYFCTMMALRAPNTNLLDILFASPIMIYGTVIGPSVGGEGIREVVFGLLLGAKSGVATAVLFGHLGWWVGDVVPFLIGVPIFWLRSRPRKDVLMAELAAAREQAAHADSSLHLTPWDVAAYRWKLLDCVLLGAAAGVLGGALIGLGEAAWVQSRIPGLVEASAFWWGPIVYGLVFVAFGMGIGAALAFLYLVLDRFPSNPITFGLVMAGVTGGGGVIFVWRFVRDVLARHLPNLQQLASLAAIICGAMILMAIIAWAVARAFPKGKLVGVAGAVLAYAALVALGTAYGKLNAPRHAATAFTPSGHAGGPNMILIVADALRADALKFYSPAAVANTPFLAALTRDAVVFDHWFSQASWTKPSFATIFTGRYPSAHTATSQMSMLPKGIPTFPGILEANGYYTKGFANNPHITTIFNFNQGFTDYVDLKKRLYFKAGVSASNLSLYEILRHGWNKVLSKVSNKMDVTEAYQPAETVTARALEWLDSPERPKNAPFFLFLHYMDPHDPYMDHAHPGVGYARVQLGDNLDPAKYRDLLQQAYVSDVEHLDRHLGVLFDGLRQRGLYDDAVVAFTADHGEEFHDHNGWWHGQTLFDELIQAPMLLKLPKQASGGTVNADLGRHVDLGPTLLHFAGLKPDPSMSGKSVLADNGEFTNADIKSVYAENDFENNIMQAARTKECKVIRSNPDNPRRRAPLETYDLTADPHEQQNLTGQGRPCETELDRLIAGMLDFTRGAAAEPTETGGLSPEQEEQLRGLGYLGAK